MQTWICLFTQEKMPKIGMWKHFITTNKQFKFENYAFSQKLPLVRKIPMGMVKSIFLVEMITF